MVSAPARPEVLIRPLCRRIAAGSGRGGHAHHLGVGSAGLGDADGAAARGDHRPAVADDHELRFGGLAGDQRRQPLDVDTVKKAVDLIEGIEGRGTETLQREQETERRERLLATGHGGQPPHRLAAGMGHERETALQRIVAVVELKMALAVGQAGEDAAEMAVDGAEGFEKGLLAQGGDGLDTHQQLLTLAVEHLEPFGQFGQAGIELLEFTEGQHVDRLKLLHAALQIVELTAEGLKAGLPHLVGHLGAWIGQAPLLLVQSLLEPALLLLQGLAALPQLGELPATLLLLLPQPGQGGLGGIPLPPLLTETFLQLREPLLEPCPLLLGLLPAFRQLPGFGLQGLGPVVQPLPVSFEGFQPTQHPLEGEGPLAPLVRQGVLAAPGLVEGLFGLLERLLQQLPLTSGGGALVVLSGRQQLTAFVVEGLQTPGQGLETVGLGGEQVVAAAVTLLKGRQPLLLGLQGPQGGIVLGLQGGLLLTQGCGGGLGLLQEAGVIGLGAAHRQQSFTQLEQTPPQRFGRIPLRSPSEAQPVTPLLQAAAGHRTAALEQVALQGDEALAAHRTAGLFQVGVDEGVPEDMAEHLGVDGLEAQQFDGAAEAARGR